MPVAGGRTLGMGKGLARILLLVLISLGLGTIFCSRGWARQPLRVGIFQNKPIVYFDEQPAGLFVEVLDAIAHEQQWEVDYRQCELQQCLSLLQQGQIDLMPSLGKTPERAKYFTFSHESVWTFWGTIYAAEQTVFGIFDLEGKTIGVRRHNKTTRALEQLLAEFHITAELHPYDNYEQAYAALKKGDLDAIAVNNTYGFAQQREMSVYKTPIVFNAFSSFFAAAKNSPHAALLPVIDRAVRQMKTDPQSPINHFHHQWFDQGDTTSWTLSQIAFVCCSLVVVTSISMAVWRYRSLVHLNRQLQAQIRQREQTEAALEKSNEELQQFAYVASHDLQEPLRAINGYLTLLGEKYEHLLAEQDRRFIKRPLQATYRLQKMIKAMLVLSRIGVQSTPLAPVDCTQIVQQVCQDLAQYRAQTQATITHDPLPVLFADGRQLEQLFRHLLVNALTYSRDEPPKVHITATQVPVAEQQAVCWQFAVQDNGMGFDAEAATRIFHLFRRLQPQSNIPGTGVGLALCKKIVERHGGSISATSQPGKGSTFLFTLCSSLPPQQS